MNYENLIETVSLIVENEGIHKEGLTLTYTLNEKNHKQMNEELFYKSNTSDVQFKASDEFDMLKFFMQIAWEIGALNDKKYIALSSHLTEIGKMLGGWNGQLAKQNSPNK